MAMAASHECFQCGLEVGPLSGVGRRDQCLACGSDLHCCRNCTFYAPSTHNQCREPQAERQVDKERGNFCEYFRFRERMHDPLRRDDQADARMKLDSLFRRREQP